MREFASTTPAKITVGALLGASLAATTSYKHETQRTFCIPLAFSEVTQIERDAAAAGTQLGNVNLYLPKVNDCAMKIFECWNLAHGVTTQEKGKQSVEWRFASHLSRKLNRGLDGYHYSLHDLLEEVPQRASACLKDLQEFRAVAAEAPELTQTFDSTWDDRHVDTTHTEVYFEPVTTTDSQGESSTHMEMRTREVYDYTTHTYTYHPQAGERAAQLANAFFEKHPQLSFQEQLRTTSQTHTEGESASIESRASEKRKEPWGKTDLLRVANIWHAGSTLRAHVPRATAAWAALSNDCTQWGVAKNSAHSNAYRTYSHSDNGPEEFQVANRAEHNSKVLTDELSATLRGFETGLQIPRTLRPKIEQLINATIALEDGAPSKSNAYPQQLTREIMNLTRTLYTSSFEKGIDTKQFRGHLPYLFGFLGVFAGGAAVGGINAGVRALRSRYGAPPLRE